MTSLDSSPLIVAMVQVATSLPMFLLAIPAGALSDIVDRRKFLLAGELFIMGSSIVLAVLVSRHLITPASLLLMTFIVSVGSAMTGPPWQAVVNVLVPKGDLQPAIALNSAGVNVSRAVGPALGGLAVSVFGIAAPFWIDALSNAGGSTGHAEDCGGNYETCRCDCCGWKHGGGHWQAAHRAWVQGSHDVGRARGRERGAG
jgi:MFS family permease